MSFIVDELNKKLSLVRLEAAAMQRLVMEGGGSRQQMQLLNDIIISANSLEDLLMLERG